MRGAAAAAPVPKTVIERWKELLEDAPPYRDAKTLIDTMQVDAGKEMLTWDQFLDKMVQYWDGYSKFVNDIATQLRSQVNKQEELESVNMAHRWWNNLMYYGWDKYQNKYARASKVLQRSLENESRYFDERRAVREARRLEKATRLHSQRLRELEQQGQQALLRSQQRKVGIEAESASEQEESDEGTKTEDEPDFTKEAEEEVDEEEVQEQLPSHPTITPRTLREIPEPEELAKYSQTLSKENKLNAANAILVLNRLDEILAEKSQKLEKKGLVRMPGFSIQATGKIVKTGKQSSYALMSAAIKRTIAGLEKKKQPAAAGRTASSSSSSSSSSRSSAFVSPWAR
jgi:hypothetical protein